MSGADNPQQVRTDVRRGKIVGGLDEVRKEIGKKQASDDR